MSGSYCSRASDTWPRHESGDIEYSSSLSLLFQSPLIGTLKSARSCVVREGREVKKKRRGTPTARRSAIQLDSNVAPANSRVSGSLQAKLTAAPMKAVISAAENSVWHRGVYCIFFFPDERTCRYKYANGELSWRIRKWLFRIYLKLTECMTSPFFSFRWSNQHVKNF